MLVVMWVDIVSGIPTSTTVLSGRKHALWLCLRQAVADAAVAVAKSAVAVADAAVPVADAVAAGAGGDAAVPNTKLTDVTSSTVMRASHQLGGGSCGGYSVTHSTKSLDVSHTPFPNQANSACSSTNSHTGGILFVALLHYTTVVTAALACGISSLLQGSGKVFH